MQQKEKELKESEDYWTKRISEMEKQHVKLGKIMDDEYHKALKEISCQTPRVSSPVVFIIQLQIM